MYLVLVGVGQAQTVGPTSWIPGTTWNKEMLNLISPTNNR